MTIDVPFALVDVFTARPLESNPVAIVPDADDLQVGQLRAIAREFNQSETTFLVRPSLPTAHWRLRSFTPGGVEVLGAGHNALGAWLWLAQTGRLPVGETRFVQQIGDALLPLTVTGASEAGPDAVLTVTMSQAPGTAGAVLADRVGLAAALGLAESNLQPGAAQVYSTGVGHVLVPVRDRATVDRAVPDAGALSRVLRTVTDEGVYVYSLDPVDPGSIAYARFFNPSVGIAEDPATGTAAGPLAARLVAEGRAERDTTLVIEQGAALGRPSSLRVVVTEAAVLLSGSGRISAEGVLHL